MSSRLSRAFFIYIVFIIIFLASQRKLWQEINTQQVLTEKNIILPIFIILIAIISYYISLMFDLV